MFRLLKYVSVLVIGVYIGFQGNMTLMLRECAAGEGQWTGTICVGSELLQ